MENLESKSEQTLIQDKPSLTDFTRKSVVGAVYRVGASFALDALYLTGAGALTYYLADREVADSISKSSSDFASNLDASKLARIAAFVVGINFVDYRFKVTDRLDKAVKNITAGIKNRIKYRD